MWPPQVQLYLIEMVNAKKSRIVADGILQVHRASASAPASTCAAAPASTPASAPAGLLLPAIGTTPSVPPAPPTIPTAVVIAYGDGDTTYLKE